MRVHWLRSYLSTREHGTSIPGYMRSRIHWTPEKYGYFRTTWTSRSIPGLID